MWMRGEVVQRPRMLPFSIPGYLHMLRTGDMDSPLYAVCIINIG